MPLNVTCRCGQRLAVKEGLAGKTVKCPKCAAPLAIPSAGSSHTKPKSPNPAPTGAKPSAAHKGAGSQSPLAELLDEMGLTASRTGRRCPECFSDMVPEAIICIECGFNTETGRRIRTKRDILDGRK